MRTRDAYLIIRFLTWPPAILAIIGLGLIGFVIDGLGLNKPRHPADLVCLGQMEYDIGDRTEKNKLLEDMSGWNVAPSRVLQQPPCSGFGSPVSQATLKKLFDLRSGNGSPAS